MKECFKMNFLGQDIILPKNIVHFEEDFGLVETLCLQELFYRELLFGIVDKKFNILVPLIPLKNLDKYSIIDNKIILKLTNDLSLMVIEKIGENLNYCSLPFLDYELIDDNLLKATNVFFKEMYAFYDINKKEFITPYFHHISDFYYDKNTNGLIALATYYIDIDEDNYKQIITYINIKGEIVSPYIDCSTGIEYDQTMDFNNVLSIIRNNEVYTRK